MLTDLNHTKRDLVNSTDLFILLTLISISTAIIILEIHGGIGHGDMHTLLGIIATIAGDIMDITTIMTITMIFGVMQGIILGTIGITVGMVIIMNTTILKIIGSGIEATTMEVDMIIMEKEVITITPIIITIQEQDLVDHIKELMMDLFNKQAE